ncbi:MAG: hypothetical protein VKL42_04930 [Snowella sp.]|nr:hypothetical protein [Snowella sp.]
MNKVILQRSIFSGLIGVTLWVSMAASVGSQSTVLEVVVPDTATVVRKQGNPLTGRLMAFGETKLTVEAGGYSETVRLNQVRSVNFKGDVWIEGQSLPSRVRGDFPKIIEALPIKAFKLNEPPKTAKIALETMSDQGLQRLLRDTHDKSYGVKVILLDSSQKMTVKIAELEINPN